MAKQAAIRVVKSMMVSCDKVGNLVLIKFALQGGSHACVFMPAHIVFWLLQHLPVNQDPALQPPPQVPEVFAEDWDFDTTPRVGYLQCKQMNDALRMNFELENQPELTVVLDRSNIELLRVFLERYRGDLMDLGVF